MKDPKTMEYPEIIGEIQALRTTLREKGQRIFELTRILHDRVRKQGADDYTSRYLAFAQANVRFVGGMEQGLQRIASIDRLVGTIQKEQKEAEEQVLREKREKERQVLREKREKERPKKRGYEASASPLADLTELFGQEMIEDAAR